MDASAPDIFYVDGLAAPNTVNTTPQGTLRETADHGTAAAVLLRDGGEGALIDVGVLAERLQAEGAEAFIQSWRELLQAIDAKSTAVSQHAATTVRR
jgi:transaldolase